ncbi:hypothetical protein [Acidipila sp. EB88]|uniref:hypothetical protein n=1 Tax=Acidipila sp. EB88 TaxID=2305226 RepID=UPI000F5F1C3C|nr:hypothetical protein [Acidipila sp. EB88]RRA47273.1 hypothetical protein D1Y84_02165 [Acidipila sp. EB88]
MRFHVATLRPAGYQHSDGFCEIAETLEHALRALGHFAARGENSIDATAANILLGAHMLPEEDLAQLPASTIIYNLEQLAVAPLPPWYMALATRFPIWDYSPLNLALWNRHPCATPPVLVPVGFTPQLQRIPTAVEQDIDVLFYGSLSPRREALFAALSAAGVRLHVAFGVYGAERDALIARARLVLCVHAHEAPIFETVRVSYLLTNHKAVVAEHSDDAGLLAEAVAMLPYDEIVQGCLALLADHTRRADLAQRGAALFATMPETQFLTTALATTTHTQAPPETPSFPRSMNLGSGKDWRAECLNIDINDHWQPDAVFNLADPFPGAHTLHTDRFGPVVLEPGCLDEILANDVLEHIPDLMQAMTNALLLLRPGGLFRIHVPYDLAWGAWQDPTHVRAFNERSWLYYTEWFWYMGWTDARFTIDSLDFCLSPLGESLRDSGAGDELVRTPRAVDSMRVVLRKQLLNAEEKQRGAAFRQQPERRTHSAPALAPA